MDTRQIEQNLKRSKQLRKVASTYNTFAATSTILSVIAYYGAALTLKDKSYLPLAIFLAVGISNNIQTIRTLAKANKYHKQARELLEQNIKLIKTK